MIKPKQTPLGVLNNSCVATIVCGICLIEMDTINEKILQCKTCNKCVHNKCMLKWKNDTCIYCRN